MIYTDVEVIYDMPDHEYHAASGFGPGQFVTRSMLWCLDQSEHGAWLRYKQKSNRAQFSGSKSTRIGDTIEARLLDLPPPYQPRPEAIIINGEAEDFNLRKPSHRAWRDEQKENGIEFIEGDALEDIAIMEESVRMTPECMYLINKRTHEQVTVRAIAQTEHGPLPVQVRIDLLKDDPEKGFLADTKSTKSGSEKWMSAVEDFGYHYQDVMYSDIWAALRGYHLPFIFIVVNNSYPFEAWNEVLSPIVTDTMRTRLDRSMNRCKALLDSCWQDVKRGKVDSSGQFHISDVGLWWLHKYDAKD